MYKKAVLVSAKGNLYYSTDFFHMGLKTRFQFNLSIFRQFSSPGFSVGTPYLFNTDGTIPERVSWDHEQEGDEIIYFGARREYRNFQAKNKLTPHTAYLDPNYPSRINPHLA